MGMVTGKFCVFVAKSQIVPIPPNMTAFQLMKRMDSIGHFIMEQEEKGGGILRGQIGSLGMKTHTP